MNRDIKSANRPEYDNIIQLITDYVLSPKIDNKDIAFKTARLAFYDAIGCGILALSYPQCTKLLGPIVAGAEMIYGVNVPGTNYKLDPVRAAFNIGTIIRWLDYNDTWLAAEWGHPSDNLGAIWSIAQYISNENKKTNKPSFLMKDVLRAMIMSYEIQGVIALENSFNQVGLDHVLLVRLASTAVVSAMLGNNRNQIMAAISNSWIDGSSLRTYRHAPNAGSRKSWAAGDASARAVQLSLMARAGEMGYPSALTAKKWGFQDVSFNSKDIICNREFSSYVMENILFKVSFPAEFHAQTAVECAIKLHNQIKNKISKISKINVYTQESAIRIIDKTGRLDNPADRDHCLQYMIAVPLLKGSLTADDYEDYAANNPQIDALRNKMYIYEDKKMSEEYLDPDKRAIGNAIQIEFNDNSKTELVKIDYPLGHKRRREESIPILNQKFSDNLSTKFLKKRCELIENIVFDQEKLENTTVDDFKDLLKA